MRGGDAMVATPVRTIGGGDVMVATDASNVRPTAPARLHEWGGFLMGARPRASRNRADAAVGGGGKKNPAAFLMRKKWT